MEKLSYILIRVRTKLQARHLSEWFTLLDNEKVVLATINEEYTLKISASQHDKRARIGLQREWAARLSNLVIRQRQAHQELKVRHEQEMALLGQVIETLNKWSN